LHSAMRIAAGGWKLGDTSLRLRERSTEAMDVQTGAEVFTVAHGID
jgi:hypothetical protein